MSVQQVITITITINIQFLVLMAKKPRNAKSSILKTSFKPRVELSRSADTGDPSHKSYRRRDRANDRTIFNPLACGVCRTRRSGSVVAMETATYSNERVKMKRRIWIHISAAVRENGPIRSEPIRIFGYSDAEPQTPPRFQTEVRWSVRIRLMARTKEKCESR